MVADRQHASFRLQAGSFQASGLVLKLILVAGFNTHQLRTFTFQWPDRRSLQHAFIYRVGPLSAARFCVWVPVPSTGLHRDVAALLVSTPIAFIITNSCALTVGCGR